MVQMTVLSRA